MRHICTRHGWRCSARQLPIWRRLRAFARLHLWLVSSADSKITKQLNQCFIAIDSMCRFHGLPAGIRAVGGPARACRCSAGLFDLLRLCSQPLAAVITCCRRGRAVRSTGGCRVCNERWRLRYSLEGAFALLAARLLRCLLLTRGRCGLGIDSFLLCRVHHQLMCRHVN